MFAAVSMLSLFLPMAFADGAAGKHSRQQHPEQVECLLAMQAGAKPRAVVDPRIEFVFTPTTPQERAALAERLMRLEVRSIIDAGEDEADYRDHLARRREDIDSRYLSDSRERFLFLKDASGEDVGFLVYATFSDPTSHEKNNVIQRLVTLADATESTERREDHLLDAILKNLKKDSKSPVAKVSVDLNATVFSGHAPAILKRHQFVMSHRTERGQVIWHRVQEERMTVVSITKTSSLATNTPASFLVATSLDEKTKADLVEIYHLFTKSPTARESFSLDLSKKKKSTFFLLKEGEKILAFAYGSANDDSFVIRKTILLQNDFLPPLLDHIIAHETMADLPIRVNIPHEQVSGWSDKRFKRGSVVKSDGISYAVYLYEPASK